MSAAVPESTLTSDQLLKLSNFRRDLADDLDAAFGGAAPDVLGSIGVFNVKDYGALGDGTTDDRASIILCAVAAKAAGHGAEMVFPPGTYLISKYIDFEGFVGLTIRGSAFAVIRYPSDNTAIAADAVATSTQMARSGFLVRYCTATVIKGLAFQGGRNPLISETNNGVGVYATHATDTTMESCVGYDGCSLFAQDSLQGTSGTGNSIAVSSGIVTLTDSDTTFSTGHLRHWITVSGATNPQNDGTFLIISRPTATSVTYANAYAVAETASFAWSINDGDRVTRIERCRSYGCRGSMVVGTDSVISKCHFEQPMTPDLVGIGDTLAISGTTVTLSDARGTWGASAVGKYVRVASATTGANNGTFKILTATAAGTYTPATLTYTNASGVTEAFGGSWWIQGGEKTGIGNGASAIAYSGGTVTFTSSTASFDAGDVNKTIRIRHATTLANDGHFRIVSVISSTQCTYANSAGVSETFAKNWAIDGYDNSLQSSLTSGSSHAIYVFAGQGENGRSNIKIDDCTFRGIRTVCVKVSGSSTPIRNVTVSKCTAIECGSFFIGGADDTQEHSNLDVVDNVLIDCATGRGGWSEAIAIQVLGARGVSLKNNKLHYSRNAVRAVDGSADLAGMYGVQAARYVIGRSQPIEDVMIEGNVFTGDPSRTQARNIMTAPISFESVGQRKIHGGGADAALTKSGTTMTLTSTIGLFSQSLVRGTITLVNNGGNNITDAVITSVPSATTLTYENAGGSAAGVGTFRITPPGAVHAGACHVRNNELLNVGSTGILCENNVAPQLTGNTFSGVDVLVQFQGDVSPRFTDNQCIHTTHDGALIRFNSGVSWPIVANNAVTNNALSSAKGWGVGIGVNGATYRDFPLLGLRGRALPTDGKEEVVVAFGSEGSFVDGDSITVTNASGAVAYTYKLVAPAGNEFNDKAGLLTLITGQAGIDAADYGTGFEDSAGSAANVATDHIRIRQATASANTDGTLTVTVSALNPNVLVLLTNTASPNATCGGRGSGSAGPVADKVVIWSPCVSFDGTPTLVGDNLESQVLLAHGAAASGLITCATVANLADTDYMTIGDGVSAPKLYEFDVAGNGVTAGRVQVNVSTDTTAAQVAARLRTAILANQPSLSVTDNANGTLTVTSLLRGTPGNVTMTENVTHASFTVTGLSGGTLGGYRKLGSPLGEDGGAGAVLQLGTTAGTEQFRWSVG